MARTERLHIDIDIDETLKKMRQATREAHEAIQGLKQAKKDIEDVWKQIDHDITQVIAEHTAAGLKGYDAALHESIDKAQAAVDKRFDDITDILLGEDARCRGMTLKEAAQRIADAHRERAMRVLGVESLD